MMTKKFNKLLAELAVAGAGHHYHAEAEAIAKWLDEVEHKGEAAMLIRLQSLMNQGKYQEALNLPGVEQFSALAPFLLFCEWRLSKGSAFDTRIEELYASDDPLAVRFADGMRLQGGL